MTRFETETEIAKHLTAIKKIYKKYNPEGIYLSLTITDRSMMVNNEHWDADRRKPIDYFRHEGSAECNAFERIDGQSRDL